MVLRIEDTDQNRIVENAESYIEDALNWCGLVPDESPQNLEILVPTAKAKENMLSNHIEKLVRKEKPITLLIPLRNYLR